MGISIGICMGIGKGFCINVCICMGFGRGICIDICIGIGNWYWYLYRYW